MLVICTLEQPTPKLKNHPDVSGVMLKIYMFVMSKLIIAVFVIAKCTFGRVCVSCIYSHAR